jgi:hypothetical protein
MRHLNITCDEEPYQWLLGHLEVNKSALFVRTVGFLRTTGKLAISDSDLENTFGRIK